MAGTIDVDALADEVIKGLTEYVDLAADEMKAVVKKAGDTVKTNISANVPKRTGKFAKSWRTMTHEEVIAMMGETGIPFAYDHFAEGEAPNPPFITFLYPESNNFAADGVVYFKKNKLHVELYTDR